MDETIDYSGYVDEVDIADVYLRFRKAVKYRCKCGCDEVVKVYKYSPKLVYCCTKCYQKVLIPHYNFVYEERIIND
jgi:hypothetical protein